MKNEKSRRNFLKKMAWGGAIAGSISSVKAIAKQPSAFHPTPNNHKEYWKLIRQDFPLLPHRIYFNTGSLGPSPQIVMDTVFYWMKNLNGIGEGGHEKIPKVREKLASFINCKPEEVTFTRNTTEGINIMAQSLPLEAGDEIILTKHAHVGGAAPWLALKKEKSISIRLIELDLTGKNNLEIIKNAVSSKTKAIVISHVTCTTGMVLPIKEINEFCRSKNIYTCIDGAHPLGMMQLDMKDLKPDFYASSGHKWLLGPKGTGILYINKNIIQTLKPSFVGAHSDKNYSLDDEIFEYGETAKRHEYGTRNTPIILGLGAAIDYISQIGILNIEHRGKSLATYLKNELSNFKKIEILTPIAPEYSASIVSFRIKGMKQETIQQKLKYNPKCRVRGIHENNLNAIRISCAFYNSFEEIDRLIAGIEDIL